MAVHVLIIKRRFSSCWRRSRSKPHPHSIPQTPRRSSSCWRPAGEEADFEIDPKPLVDPVVVGGHHIIQKRSMVGAPNPS